MRSDLDFIREAYVSQVEGNTSTPQTEINRAASSDQEQVKKALPAIKDWIRIPFINTPFKARMAAILIVELISNMTESSDLRDLVLKEIRTSNRLNRKG